MTQQKSDGPELPRTATVAVIGAGMAGLVAARELRGQGIDVVVLESASRPGGRVLAETTALGSRVDLGGQWIGHGHHRFAALAAELGLPVFAMRTPARPTVVDGAGELRNPVPAVATLLVLEILSRLGVPGSWRSRSMREWLRRVPGRRTRRLLEVILAVSSTADLDRFSVPALLALVRYQGGLPGMLSTAGGAQDSLVVDGAGTLAERIATDLGDRVVYDSRVTAVHRDAAGVTIHTVSGEFRADKAVVTVPAPVAATVAHHPPLPADRIRLQDNTYMGSVYKAIAVYERPFWRDRGHAEMLVLTEPGLAVFDTSPPQGPGHLCVLVAGADARTLDTLDDEARRTTILGPLAERFGADILTPAGWHDKLWHRDEHVAGGYTALPILGHDEGYFPHPSAPVGNLHWAGSETASEHAGYIEGAIESGERVAREVAAALANRADSRS